MLWVAATKLLLSMVDTVSLYAEAVECTRHLRVHVMQ